MWQLFLFWLRLLFFFSWICSDWWWDFNCSALCFWVTSHIPNSFQGIFYRHQLKRLLYTGSDQLDFFKSRLSNSHISFYWIAVGEKKSLLLIASIIVYIDISWKCYIWSLIKYFSPTSHSAAQGPWPQYGSLWTGNKWGTLNLVSMWIDILTLNKYAHISVSGFFFFCFQRFYSDYQTAMSMLISLIFLSLSYFLTTILL